MRKGEVINGYTILKDSIPAGGRGEISFAQKGGKEYFIKVFLAPKYPVAGSPGSPKTIAEKQKRCDIFEKHHKELNAKIATKVAEGGNLIYAIDFFRNGTCYYKINEKVDVSTLKAKDISKLPTENKLILLKTLSHSLKILHDLGIVHGDLKPDNILIKRTATGNYTSKLIDFDDSYFSGNPPDYTEIVGTPDYYSPELLNYVKDNGKSGKSDLTTKSDIFTLGVIFTEYLLGNKPAFNPKYSSLAQSVADGNVATIKIKDFSEKIENLVNSMLAKEQDKRPDIKTVFETLKSSDSKIGDSVSPVISSTPTIGRLKIGKGLKVDGYLEVGREEKPVVKPTLKIGKGLKID